MNLAQDIKQQLPKLSTISGLDVRTREVADGINELNIDKNFDINNYFGGTSVVSRVVNTKSLDEVLFDARARVKIETSKVSMHLNPTKIQKLYSQIDSMHDPEDWDEDLKAVGLESYRAFLAWYILVKPEKGAGLGLGDNGNLIAAWAKNIDRLIIEFLPKHRAKWFIARKVDDDLEIASGTAFVGRLPIILDPYDVNNIFFKKE